MPVLPMPVPLLASTTLVLVLVLLHTQGVDAERGFSKASVAEFDLLDGYV